MTVFNYPPYFCLMKQPEQAVVEQVVSRLCAMKSAVGIRWGGSTTQLTDRAEWADVDLWFLVQSGTEQEVKQDVLRLSAHLADIVFRVDMGQFEFFGHLVSLFFFAGCAFGVDVGICTSESLLTATPGVSSVLVWGSWPDLASQRKRRTGPPVDRRLDMILVNLIKVRKALHRGYLWNAIEYTARARRQLMGLIIGDGPTKELRYSRADHSVEASMSAEELKALSVTCPYYSRQHIGQCASLIGQSTIEWAEEHHVVWTALAQLRQVTESIQVPASSHAELGSLDGVEHDPSVLGS